MRIDTEAYAAGRRLNDAVWMQMWNMQEVEDVVNPIMTRAYEAAAAASSSESHGDSADESKE